MQYTDRSQRSSGNMPDCGVRGPRFESHRGQLHVYRKNHCDYSIGLYTHTAVPRSTQPSTMCRTVKWVSAFGLSNNNKWRWWVWLLAAYRQTRSPGRLAWAKDLQPLGAVPYSSYEPGELSQWLCYDDSTINILMLIIIIIKIILKNCAT